MSTGSHPIKLVLKTAIISISRIASNWQGFDSLAMHLRLIRFFPSSPSVPIYPSILDGILALHSEALVT